MGQSKQGHMVNGRKTFTGHPERLVPGDDAPSEVTGESLAGIEAEKRRGKSSKKKKKTNNKKKENKKEKNLSSYHSITTTNTSRIDASGSVEGGLAASDGVWPLSTVPITY